MGCEKSTVKCLLFAFNVVFLLSGVALITVGALIKTEVSEYNEAIPPQVHTFAIVFIVIGSVVTVVSFFGCCGAVIENRCMILTFTFFLGVIFIVEVVLGILIFAFRSDVEDKVHTYMTDTWMEYDPQKRLSLSAVIDSYQQTFQCCGVDSYVDWMAINAKRSNFGGLAGGGSGPNMAGIANTFTASVPDSCCKEGKSGCGEGGIIQGAAGAAASMFTGSQKTSNINTNGCFTQIKNLMHLHGNIVAGVVLGVSVVELIGLVFACYLASSIKKDKRLRNFV